MTVAELIKLLQQFDGELPVCYLDYEQGPSDVSSVELASVRHVQLKMPKPFSDDEYVSIS